ncbi:MAG: hypothetical protein IPH88_07720 [Bacteroidales bacterium]|nr:hypothetical protein [Bacteroidales bacterium]
MTNTQPWVACSTPNLAFCFTTVPYPTKISFYQASDCINTAVTTSASNCFSVAANAQMNCLPTPPAAFAMTGGGSYCQGGNGVAVGLAGSQINAVYTFSRMAMLRFLLLQEQVQHLALELFQ